MRLNQINDAAFQAVAVDLFKVITFCSFGSADIIAKRFLALPVTECSLHDGSANPTSDFPAELMHRFCYNQPAAFVHAPVLSCHPNISANDCRNAALNANYFIGRLVTAGALVIVALCRSFVVDVDAGILFIAEYSSD